MQQPIRAQRGIDLLLAVAEHDDRIRELLAAGASDSCEFEVAAGLDRQSRFRARNAALLEVAALLAVDDPGAWVTAGRVSLAIQRFMSRVLPNLQPGRHHNLSPSDAALHRAWLCGVALPASQDYVYRLLR